MGADEAQRQVARILRRLESEGPAAQRRWLRQHGVRVHCARTGADGSELSRLTDRLANQVLDAVHADVATAEELKQILLPESVRLSPPDVVAAADAHPGPPTGGKGHRAGETFYAYSRERRRIGWLYVAVGDDGTLELHGLYTDPEYRRRGVARYLLLTAQNHFGHWRSWAAVTSDPAEGALFDEAASEQAIRIAPHGTGVSSAPEDVDLGSRSAWQLYLG